MDRTQLVYDKICDDTIVKVYANLVSADTLPKLLYIHRVYLEYGYGGYYFLKNVDDNSNLSVIKYRGNVDWQAISNTLSRQVVPQEAARILNSDGYLSKAKNRSLITAFLANEGYNYLEVTEFKSRETLINSIARILVKIYGENIDHTPTMDYEYEKSEAVFGLYRVILEEANAVENQIEGIEENKNCYKWCNFETFEHDWSKIVSKEQQAAMYKPKDFLLYEKMMEQAYQLPDNNKEE